MLITRGYLLKKPGKPSAAKQFLDTRVVPVVVNGAGAVEVGLNRLSARTGVRPVLILGAGFSALVSYLLFRTLHHRGSAADKRVRFAR